MKTVLSGLPRALKHDYVITYEGQPIRQKDGFKRSMKTACKNAEIPYGRKTENGITFHDIRRTVKTNMLNAGIDKAHRDMILGHSLQGMDAYYLIADEAALEKAMANYTDWLDRQIENLNHYDQIIIVKS